MWGGAAELRLEPVGLVSQGSGLAVMLGVIYTYGLLKHR